MKNRSKTVFSLIFSILLLVIAKGYSCSVTSVNINAGLTQDDAHNQTTPQGDVLYASYQSAGRIIYFCTKWNAEYDPAGNNFELMYNFGDGQTETYTSTTSCHHTSHTYTNPGKYTITVTVKRKNVGDPGKSASCDVVVWNIEITSAYGIASTDKFIPFSPDSNKNKFTVKYKINPQDIQLDNVKIQVFRNDGTTKVYEQTYTDISHTKYTGTDLTITWNGTDNQTSKNYADPSDNIHKIKLVGTKNTQQYETSPMDVNVVPRIVKVFPTHTPFSANAVVPQTLTITTVIKAQVDNTEVETNNYRYYTENGNSVSIWDGNHYYADNHNANYYGTYISYWIEILNQTNIATHSWNESNLGSLEYTWSRIRAPGDKNLTDSNNDGVITDTFSQPGTYVYRVKVTNKVGSTILQEILSPGERDRSSPENVVYTENINDIYMIHLKEDSNNDAYSWATSFLKVPYNQRSSPVDYHGLDCSGLVHASHQLTGNWNTMSRTEAHIYLTSSSYSSALGSPNPKYENVSATRNDWVGVDQRTAAGDDDIDNDKDGQTDEFDEGFDGNWGHIMIIYEYSYDPNYTENYGHKYSFIHARGSTCVEKGTHELYLMNPRNGQRWNIIFRRPNN